MKRVFVDANIVVPAFPLKLVDFSEELLRMCGMFRNFVREFINNCNYDSTDSFNRGCFHA